jgi:beta-lactam-binding protein with PASTA domain
MRILKFIFSKFFWINLIVAIFCLIGTVYYVMSKLDQYTNHSIRIEIPNFIGIQINDLKDSIDEPIIRYEIRDSVFSDIYPVGMIIQQDPRPHSKNFANYIKPNRNLYLTIVKKQETFKIIPDLISNVNSKNIGKSKLEMLGFIVELEIKDHKDKDKVLDIRFNNKSIRSGKELIKGSTVKLIYGSGDKGKPIELPDFVGMNVLLANLKASEIGLDLEIHYSDSVVNLMDSNKSVIYNQYPDPEKNNKHFVSIGSLVILDASLSISLDSIYRNDTIGLKFN